ncbi:MAG: PcfJ domain-containing protein [Verrucomicrobiota bacterium]
MGGTTNLQWRPLGVGWSLETAVFTGGDTDVWTFEELTQSSDLWEEGVAMGHCVAGYDEKCFALASVILSVRLNGMRVLTVELSRRSKAVVQVKGRFNREPTEAESAVIEQWHEEVVVGGRREVFAFAA